jgi:RNA polymerase sigma-70 factor (ECF subfamily)
MDEDIHQQLDAREYRGAFELLLERYQDRVFRLACGLLRNETMAEDIAQDIFLKIWRALPGFQHRASLSTWIFTIARNTCLTQLKRQRPTLSLSEPETREALERSPELQQTDTPEGAGMDVQFMLDQLPEKYRRVIALYYLEQKSYEEVAAMLGLPMGTVKTFLHRARKELLKLAARSERAMALA